MAHFIASVQGQSGAASRIGSKRSGIEAHPRGWNVGVRVVGHEDSDVGDEFLVYMTSGSTGGDPDVLLGSVHLQDGTPYFEPSQYAARTAAETHFS